MKFLHSMIRVTNEKEMTKFYRDFLGFKLGKRVRLEDCCLQYLKDSESDTEIEFTINDEKEQYVKGNQFGHFAFSCKNLNEIDKKIKDMGYKWYVEPFFLKEVSANIAFIKDPDGNEIELIEEI